MNRMLLASRAQWYERRNAPAKRGSDQSMNNGPEEVPGGLDVLRQLHQAVLGVDAPVDGAGRRPAAGGRRRLPHLDGERFRHPPLQCWGSGSSFSVDLTLFLPALVFLEDGEECAGPMDGEVVMAV